MVHEQVREEQWHRSTKAYLKYTEQNTHVVKIKAVDLVERFRMVLLRPLYDQIRPQLGPFYFARVSFLIARFLIARKYREEPVQGNVKGASLETLHGPSGGSLTPFAYIGLTPAGCTVARTASCRADGPPEWPI